jgi:hypothetical protein
LLLVAVARLRLREVGLKELEVLAELQLTVQGQMEDVAEDLKGAVAGVVAPLSPGESTEISTVGRAFQTLSFSTNFPSGSFS